MQVLQTKSTHDSDPKYQDDLYINIECKHSLYFGMEWYPYYMMLLCSINSSDVQIDL